MLFCRDELQHLSYANVWKAFENIAKCDARWITIGDYWPGENLNVRGGEYFNVNLCLPPFELRPNEIVSERATRETPVRIRWRDFRNQVAARKLSAKKT